MTESPELRPPSFLRRHRRARWFLAVAAYIAVSCYLLVPDGLNSLGPLGTGLERPAEYRAAAVSDRDLLMAFTIGYAPNPRPYAFLTPTSRMGWAKIALADLGWYGPNDPPARARAVPSFSDDTAAFARETSGRPLLPILDMPLLMPEAGDRRFLVDAAARHGTCLVRHGDTQIILVRSADPPGGAPQFARIQAPERAYKRWWSDPVHLATYPVRLLLVVGFLLLVGLVGMH